MSKQPFPAPVKHLPKHVRSLAALALALAGACAPRGARVPTVPVVVIRDTVVTNRPPATPRDTMVIGPSQPSRPAGPAANATPVSVGLIIDTSRVEITSAGDFTVHMEDGREVGRARGGQTVEFRDEGSTISVASRGGAPGSAMQRPSGMGAAGLRPPLLVRSVDGGTLTLRGQPYRGELRIQQAPGGGLTVVNRLDMETYLQGVVPREIGRFDLDIYEAIKAQAVAARTYAYTYLGRRAEQGFDVYATVEDQVYGGAGAENETVNRAVRETSGEILAYNGRPITAYYHSTCAGQTAAIDEVWNNAPVPYLVSVRDVDAGGQAYDRSSSRFSWTVRWTHDQLVGILNRTLADSLRGRRISRIEDMRILERTPSDRVRAMRIQTDAGTFTVGKDRVRWILRPTAETTLNSSKFDIQLSRGGGRITEVVANGGGWGHGIGMCQVGAMGRARAGQDYRTILRTYYPGTVIQALY
ncbi:SpoIID/LytB domain-containing protein [Longimicrobium sp.]|uniref:SpoIID/LytB domain-containing protein n=1 Tax=Longimicrobium sp. TaxID=2029185 RepID=UPI002E339C64|nr:SpoIID/LytB domain-containing protein [Longimicrobium sp.]HEX6041520.1 SpoIID/LytB domain-containing protein [Longimicrobium sp.]